MTKEELEKELESVIRDILNPYNDKSPEVEAWLLVEDGWCKRKEGDWIDVSDSSDIWTIDGKRVCPKFCSVCGDIYSKQYNYCPTCGAKMRKED